MEMSRSPPLMKLRASLRLDSGTTAVGLASYQSMRACWYWLNRKK